MAGLFAGMICLGLIVDQIGRKWGSVSTASIMFVGTPLALLTPLRCLLRSRHVEIVRCDCTPSSLFPCGASNFKRHYA